jgi:uncharacterized protein YndB with AHSA1/START domain
MTRLQVEVEGTTRAGPEVVWALVADATSFSEWGPWDESGYERPGDSSEHGVGAVRRIRYRRTTSLERVLEVEEGRRLVYTVVKGIPVRNYRGEVVLTPIPEGTRVRWSGTWDRTLPGRVVHSRLRSFFPGVVADLTAEADRRAGPR